MQNKLVHKLSADVCAISVSLYRQNVKNVIWMSLLFLQNIFASADLLYIIAIPKRKS